MSRASVFVDLRAWVRFFSHLVLMLLGSIPIAHAEQWAISRLAGPPNLSDFLQKRPHPSLAHANGFIQRQPKDGSPATERTDIYAGYDETNLYVVFIAHDREPEKIRARMTPREDITGDDNVTLMLDTFLDHRRAFVFRTNPYGVQWDALWTEGQGFDSAFDTVWHSEGQRTETGYAVLMTIPFKSLRFTPSDAQRWGIICSRFIPRGQAEESYWPRVSNRIQGRLNQEAEFVGIESISPSRNVQFIPYGTFRSFKALDRRAADGPSFITDLADASMGADTKLVVNDAMVVDVTANPDFSQIESDQPQVTVNQRFEVFFPERRPFFVENADVFRTPLNLVFTRRIADPDKGVRVTSKTGPYSIGALLIDDASPGKIVPAGQPANGTRATYAVARVNVDIGNQSTMGAIYVGREQATRSNRLGGIDGRLRLGDHWSTSFQAVQTATADVDGEQYSGRGYHVRLARQGRLFNYNGVYRDLDDTFQADAGFVPRTGIRETSHFASYFFRPEKTLIFWGPELFARRTWDGNGLRLDDIAEASLECSFTGQTSFEVNYQRARERLRPTDFPTLADNRDFDVGFWNVEYQTGFSDAFSLSGDTTWGRQIQLDPLPEVEPFSVDWLGSNLFLTLRPSTSLRIDNTYVYTRLSIPDTTETVLSDHIFRTRWNWQFTRELSLRIILQYEVTLTNEAHTSLPTRKNLNGDVVVTYRVNPWTALYAGYNGNGQNVRLVDSPGGNQLRRREGLIHDASQVFVKLSYLLRF